MRFADLKYSLRSIRKTPATSLISILVLAIGIGACTAVFSIVNAVLLRPAPYPEPDRIFVIWGKAPSDLKVGYNEIPVHGQQFNFLNSHKRDIQFFSAFKPGQFNLSAGNSSERLDGIRASADFFRAMGVQPIMGRMFSEEDDQPGKEHEVVLSYSTWKQRFDSDPGIIGRNISLNSEKYTVIGVMPPTFAFPRGGEMPKSFEMPSVPRLWVPLALPAQYRGVSDLVVVARSRSGVSRLQARAELSQDTRMIEEQDPRWKRWSDFELVPISQQLSGDLRPKILLLFASVLAVLLITCANVANLFLAKSMGRVKEVGVRVALGARRSDIVRQFLTESALLGIIGSVLGMGCAVTIVRILQSMNFARVPRLQEATVDAKVVLFAVVLAMATSVLFGLFPALEISGVDSLEALRTKDQKHSGSKAQVFRDGLLIGEVALTVTLVIAASLLVRSFMNLLNTSPGFSTNHLLTMELTLPPSKYRTPADITQMYTRVLQRLSAVPGVEAASLGKALPMSGDQEATVYYPNNQGLDPKNYPFTQYTIAGPDFFRAMGIPLLAGREFTAADDLTAGNKVIISKAMAQLYWNTLQEALGHQISLPPKQWHDMTIVGVAADIKNLSMDETPSPQMYVPFTQNPYPSMLSMQFALRTSIDAAQLSHAIQAAVKQEDPELPIANLHPISELVESSMASIRFSAMLLGTFAGIAWLLAVLGVYAIISYLVNERVRELAIRVALGAQRRDVLALVFASGARLVAVGLVAGVLLALSLSRLLAHFVYQIRAVDPLTYIVMSALVFAAGSVAILIPAQRAMRADPMTVLRAE